MIDIEKIAAAREARKAAKAEQLQADRETQHSAAREAYKKQQRDSYAGDDRTFREVVWPGLRDQWERDQVVDPVEVDKAALLSRGLYRGF